MTFFADCFSARISTSQSSFSHRDLSVSALPPFRRVIPISSQRPPFIVSSSFFFFNDTATTEIYTLSLHDALPILRSYIGCFLSSLALRLAVPKTGKAQSRRSHLPR